MKTTQAALAAPIGVRAELTPRPTSPRRTALMADSAAIRVDLAADLARDVKRPPATPRPSPRPAPRPIPPRPAVPARSGLGSNPTADQPQR